MVVNPTDVAALYATNNLARQDRSPQPAEGRAPVQEGAGEEPAVKATISKAALETARAVQQSDSASEDSRAEDVTRREEQTAAMRDEERGEGEAPQGGSRLDVVA